VKNKKPKKIDDKSKTKKPEQEERKDKIEE